jgi:hypothetical protein
MNILALALRTAGGPSGSKGDLPYMLAITALKLSLVDHFNFSTFNLERLGVRQGFGNLSVCRFHNAAEGLAGDAHTLSGVLLVEALQVRQTDGLKLVHSHGDDL